MKGDQNNGKKEKGRARGNGHALKRKRNENFGHAKLRYFGKRKWLQCVFNI